MAVSCPSHTESSRPGLERATRVRHVSTGSEQFQFPEADDESDERRQRMSDVHYAPETGELRPAVPTEQYDLHKSLRRHCRVDFRNANYDVMIDLKTGCTARDADV